jgi:RNA polymerase sigma-32 factor
VYDSKDASTARYIDRVRTIRPLDRDEEHALAVRAKDGDQGSADALVNASLRYVVAIALQYRRYPVRVEDLIAEGNIGLMTAVRKFDPHRGTRFVTYAGYWIRAYVLDHVVRSTSMVGAGSGPLRSKVFFRLRRERARLANLVADGEERNTALAERFGVTPERMRDMLARLDGHDVSLDRETYAESGVTLLDTLTDAEPLAEEALGAAERADTVDTRVEEALGALDRRERMIVEQRILADREASLAELGRKLGVSRERARQLEARAKKKLRAELRDLQAA